MSRWKWVNGTNGRLYDVGILADGILHNPNGYPEDEVRAAIAGAEERRHQRRSEAAKEAAETRRERTKRRVYQIARALVRGSTLNPRKKCHICGRRLSDTQSIERGIGSECWDSVLEEIRRAAEPQAGHAA